MSAMLSDDSDDDKPIMDLIRKRQNATKSNQPNKSKGKVIKSENNKASNGASAQPSRATGVNIASDFYETTKKGMLVQSILVRWWYAFDWPRLEEIADPPPGYELLDGFPGVFISTRVDSLGKILDLRNMDTCPNLRNLSRKHSKELKDLCITAYTNQMKQLAVYEGEDVKIYRTLRSELNKVKSIDVEAAEREAKKYKF